MPLAECLGLSGERVFLRRQKQVVLPVPGHVHVGLATLPLGTGAREKFQLFWCQLSLSVVTSGLGCHSCWLGRHAAPFLPLPYHLGKPGVAVLLDEVSRLPSLLRAPERCYVRCCGGSLLMAS